MPTIDEMMFISDGHDPFHHIKGRGGIENGRFIQYDKSTLNTLSPSELVKNYWFNKNIDENIDNDNEEDYEDDYQEYEVVQVPLWKRIVNEIRIPLFIFIIILLLSNCTFDKLLLSKLPVLGNQFNECNTYGFLLKTFLIALLSYICIRFIRI